MRRSSLVSLAFLGGLGLILLAGSACNAVRDAFSPRAETVARANDQTLSVDRLAGWATTGKQVPLDAMALSRLSHVWVDFSLFAQAFAAGNELNDSATVMAAMWPVVSQIKWERFHDKLNARGDLTPQQVDSAYAAGQVRMFQHILFQVPPNAAAGVEAQKRRQAEQLLPQARGAGARFAQLASRYSDDNGSKVQGGSLGLSTRGQFVPAFEDAAWELAPGAVSGVIKSPFGFHIIRRPPLAEVREAFRQGVEERVSMTGDSVYLDSLSIKRHIQPVSRAPAFVRTAVQDLDAARTSGRVLVDYRGGSLRVRDLARWLAALDPSIVQALPQATDDQINQFLKAIAQRELLIEQADSAKVALTAEDWEVIRAEHDSAVAMISSLLNLSPGEGPGDSTRSEEERRRIAMERVNEYMDRVVQGRTRFFPVPPFLGQTLRAKGRWSVDEAGVRRAVERAQQARGSADSGRAPRMTPAPGPAPIDTGGRSPR